jgi:exodeoxyribonuclease III
MRLMTYNILTGGVDGAGAGRLEKIRDVIRSVGPDVLVLNECNGFERNGSRAMYWLEGELGMRGVLAQAQTGFHVAVFLRQGRLLETQSLSREVHHAVLSATIDVGGLTVKVIGAHLCPFGGDARLLEVQHLIRFLREEHVFILGDLNALSPHDSGRYDPGGWLPRRRARHVFAEPHGRLDTRAISMLEGTELVDVLRARGNDAPTVLTRLGEDWENYQARIDYVFATAKGAERVRRAERVDGALVESASDHYPLFVDVDL